MMRDVTVCIPSIPPRRRMLARAIASVTAQDAPVTAISVALDHAHEGAWATRNRALAGVRTTWTAFLDDDDELLPVHLQFLLDRAEDEALDLVWPWFQVVGGTDPFPQHRGRQYDPADPHIVPIAYLVRTELLHDCVALTGGFLADERGDWGGQDFPLFDALARNGRHRGYPDTTWLWHHTAENTSGLPDRWQTEQKGPVVFR